MTMNEKRYQACKMRVFVLLLLGVAAATSVVAVQVTGIVEDAEGVPVADITVCAYAYDVPDFLPEHRHGSTQTDRSGRFTVTTPDTDDVLLVLTGDDGAGRVRVVPDGEGELLRLRYPVRTRIILLHDNDLHFNFNHLAAFRAHVDAYRERYPNVYLLNAGDVFTRHADRWPVPGEEGYFGSAVSMIETMNDVGYDVMTLGNHELAYVSDRTRQALEKASFPLLGANMEITTDKLPPLQSHHVFATEERYSVAVLGLTRFNTDGVNSLNPVVVARRYAHLGDENNVFVALTHIGNQRDRELAETVDTLDVIIGGHSHGLLETADTIGDVLFARAGGTPGGHPVDPELPKFLGTVTIVLENGAVVSKKGHVKTLDADSPATVTDEKIAPAVR